MENPLETLSFLSYVKKHGQHLTTEVAERASSLLCCKNTMSTDEVADALIVHLEGRRNKNGFTLGDFVFLTNLNIAKYHNILDNDTCVCMAVEMAESPIGYLGLPLTLFVDYLVNKDISFEW